MKKIFKIIGSSGVEEKGYLKIKGKYLRLDLQRHCVFAFWLEICSFSFILIWLRLNNILTVIISSVLALAIGWLIELAQKYMPKRNFDPIDANIMLPAAILMGLLFALIRTITGIEIPEY